MREAPSANKSWAQVLEVCVNSLMAFIFSSTISGARHDIVAIQAYTGKLSLKDPADVFAFFARTMHYIT